MRKGLLTLGAAAVLAAAPAPADAAKPRPPRCTDRADAAPRLDLRVRAGDTGRLENAFGYYAVPRKPPRGLVVFAHGHSNSAWKWRGNLRLVARTLGVAAIAMDYRRQTYPDGNPNGGDSYGWRVIEGAEDSIAAARRFERRCLAPRGGGRRDGSRTRRGERLPIVMYGVSMGGNASGIAVASRATRRDGSPLFDYWFDIEGVTNVIETYLEARAVAGPPINNKTGQVAVKEMEEEFGGSLEQRPHAYADATVVARAEDIKASGIKGVVIVHGADDGTVGYNQSPEMYARLAQVGVPTDFFTVLRRGDAPSGNTLEDTSTLGERIPDYSSPFTGHGSETDLRHPVIKLGFERLAALFTRDARPSGLRSYVVDEGTVHPQPDS